MIYKVLDISTAHISKETGRLLDECELDGGYYNIDTYGWLIACEDWDTLPDDLLECIRYAQRHDCAYIRLDVDAEIISGLPTYDW